LLKNQRPLFRNEQEEKTEESPIKKKAEFGRKNT